MRIKNAALEIQELWKNLRMESVNTIKAALKSLASDPEVREQLEEATRAPPVGVELFRAPKEGFILLAYSEKKGQYRIPHNHGDAWVVYAVVAGQVEMGNYFNATRLNGSDHLILKNRETLTAGDTRLYLPGEIHDTKCCSEDAVILRLTSLDLKEEERAGRMERWEQL
ncbi:MAG: hypothetical protein AB7K68_07750 [Bacteriovoracia bacterium]